MSEKIYSPIIYDPISKIYYKQELNTHTGIVLNPQQQFINKLIKQRDQYKAERDTLIDDIAVLKANISRLERENGQLKQQLKGTREFFVDVTKRNEELMVKSKQYTTLTNHIRLKAENNPGVSRYIDLVNYIDRLERD
ncbi:hypothetical protein QI097_00490 [Staphylococcus saprophyticus]|nr:hypothetical protein [Staphylococcus saprophyticus]